MSRFRFSLALLTLVSLATSANAGNITISRASSPGTTELTDIGSFTRTGNFLEEFHNATGIKFTDFHICFEWTSDPDDITADGDGVFDTVHFDYDPSTSVLCVTFEGQPGIAAGGYFWIQTSGFSDDLVFTLTPSVPEPTSVVLGVIGLAGVGLLGRSRRGPPKQTVRS